MKSVFAIAAICWLGSTAAYADCPGQERQRAPTQICPSEAQLSRARLWANRIVAVDHAARYLVNDVLDDLAYTQAPDIAVIRPLALAMAFASSVDQRAPDFSAYLIALGAPSNLRLQTMGLKGRLVYWPALFFAASAGQAELVRDVLNRDANIAECDEDGNTALHVLAHGLARSPADHVAFAKTLEVLLRAGVDVTTSNSAGLSGLDRMPLSRPMIETLIRSSGSKLPNPFGTKLLFRILEHGSEMSLLEAVLDLKAEPNGIGFEGKSPLMYAAFRGDQQYLEAIKVLLDAGADPNFQNDQGWSALMFAVWGGKQNLGGALNSSIVQLLLDRGANKFLVNKKGQRAFDLADSSLKEIVR